MAKYSPAQILAISKGPKSKFGNSTIHKAATELGRSGGLEGGPARAAKLKTDQLVKIARHAANVRWGVTCPPGCPYC